VALVVALVVVVALVAGSDDDGPTPAPAAASDEAAIRQVIADIIATDDGDRETAMQKYFCAGDIDLDEQLGGSGGPDLSGGTGSGTSSTPAKIKDIEVDGNKAIVSVDVRGDTARIPVTKDGGTWKVCLTAGSATTQPPR
jgi:hypothetical protein